MEELEEEGCCRHRLCLEQQLQLQHPMNPRRPLSFNNSLKRCSGSVDMDLELRCDDSKDFFKVARTDSYLSCKEPDLKMRIARSCTLGPSIRSNSPVPDRCLGSSASNPNEADGALLGSDPISEPLKLVENESLLIRNPQCYGGNSRTMPLLHQPCFYRPSDAEIVNQMAFRDHSYDGGLAPPPFTSSQFRELQHQALVFKYIMSGVRVPAELIIPVCNSVFGLANIHQVPNIGWGNYNPSYANNIDTEHGRCRRTDGKKWRCARDVVPNQKYCERHMHRGRNRARKAAENQAASSESTAIAKLCTAAVPHNTGTTSLHPSIVLNNQQKTPTPITGLKCYAGENIPQVASHFQFPFQSDTSRLWAKDYRYLNAATQFGIHLGSEQIDFFGGIPGNIRERGQESHNLCGRPISMKQQQQQQQQSFFGNGFGTEAAHVTCQSKGHFRHFSDDCRRPGDPSRHSWPGMGEDISSSSITKLSISTPMSTSSDFNTSTANSPHSKLSLSPLRLSMFSAGKEDPMGAHSTHMALGVGNMDLEERDRETNWVPIISETSLLAEVLQSSTPRGRPKKSSDLNLMAIGFENSSRRSRRITASPKAVLQNTILGFLSDSSNGSSPATTAKTTAAGFCAGDNLQISDSFSGRTGIDPAC